VSGGDKSPAAAQEMGCGTFASPKAEPQVDFLRIPVSLPVTQRYDHPEDSAQSTSNLDKRPTGYRFGWLDS
jgi:hypothetical protein